MSEKQLSYQELKGQLDAVMAKLQGGDIDVDEAIVLHKQGQELLKELDTYLQKVANQAEIEINKIN